MNENRLEHERTNWSGEHLKGFDFSNQPLRGADFSMATIEMCNFTGAYIEEANFSGAKINGCVFACAKMAMANFSEAKVYYSNFFDANLEGANLSAAWFVYVCMWGAILNRAEFHGIYMSMTDVSGTKIRNAKNLNQPALNGAHILYGEAEPDLEDSVYALDKDIFPNEDRIPLVWQGNSY